MKIQLEHRAVIEPLCAALCLPISEYCFSNIYLFRNFHAFDFHELGDNLYALTGLSYSRERFFMPLFRPSNWSECLSLAREYAGTYVYPVPKEWWEGCPKDDIITSEGDSDYVVETEMIRTYRGRRYDGHRYNVRQVFLSGELSVLPLHETPIQDARDVVEQWKQGHDLDDVPSCLEALDCLEALGLQGYTFYIDGHPEGVIIGQGLTPDMYVIHFAKSIAKSSGMYQYMYQYLAQRIPERYKFLNLEQDLGISGLRQAKSSLCPVMMIQKGRIRCL